MNKKIAKKLPVVDLLFIISNLSLSNVSFSLGKLKKILSIDF